MATDRKLVHPWIEISNKEIVVGILDQELYDKVMSISQAVLSATHTNPRLEAILDIIPPAQTAKASTFHFEVGYAKRDVKFVQYYSKL